jgi:hypothetical protein
MKLDSLQASAMQQISFVDINSLTLTSTEISGSRDQALIQNFNYGGVTV